VSDGKSRRDEVARVTTSGAIRPKGSSTRWALANSRKESQAEVALRASLHRAGFRFRKHAAISVGTRVVRVDVLFPRARLVVFVDGCFWHSCPEHGSLPQDAVYWSGKLKRNSDRDRDTDRELRAKGWSVLRLWEHVGAAGSFHEVTALLEGTYRGPVSTTRKRAE
jgi:DNA mismatch endonuclease, patch repair protein